MAKQDYIDPINETEFCWKHLVWDYQDDCESCREIWQEFQEKRCKEQGHVWRLIGSPVICVYCKKLKEESDEAHEESVDIDFDFGT